MNALLVYHLRVIILDSRLREPQLNNSKYVPCSSFARSAPQNPVTVMRLKVKKPLELLRVR